MNDNNVIFKTVLYVDEKIVAESTDLTLWQKVLQSIKFKDSSEQISLNYEEAFQENESINGKQESPIERFAKEVNVDISLINDAISPMTESPFIRLDMKTWENYKRKHFENKRPLPDVVIVGTILALWKKSANLGEATQKEVITILKQLNLNATNPSRSYKNCEWLKYDDGKIILMASKYSLATKMLIEYCEAI